MSIYNYFKFDFSEKNIEAYSIVLYLSFFFISQIFSMWGQYVTLPLKHLSNWDAYKMAIPYALIGWIFMTIAININDTYNLTQPNQVVLLLIIVQNFIMMFIDKMYFGNELFYSYGIGIALMLLGFYISLYKVTTSLDKVANKELN
jgi:hypothetical protein